MSVKVVADTDSGTWMDVADVLTLSDDQYNRLVAGAVTVNELLDEGVEEMRMVGRDEDDETQDEEPKPCKCFYCE